RKWLRAQSMANPKGPGAGWGGETRANNVFNDRPRDHLLSFARFKNLLHSVVHTQSLIAYGGSKNGRNVNCCRPRWNCGRHTPLVPAVNQKSTQVPRRFW